MAYIFYGVYKDVSGHAITTRTNIKHKNKWQIF